MSDSAATGKPLVSVIIPVFNVEGYLKETLESVLAQTYPNMEILVVDDGSTDRSLEIARSYRDRVSVLCQSNSGPAAARNLGLSHAKGKYIGFLDGDDIWFPDKTAQQVTLLEAHPEWGAVYGKLERVMPGGTVELFDLPQFPSGWIFEDLLVHRGFISIITVMVRRACFEQVGAFNEALRTAEDINMLMRLARYYQFGFLPEPTARYQYNPDGLTRRQDTKRGTFGNLNHIVELFPELHTRRSSVMREAYAMRYLQNARAELLENEDHSRTRQLSLWAIRYRPWRHEAWFLLVLSLLPVWAVRTLRRLKGSRSTSWR